MTMPRTSTELLGYIKRWTTASLKLVTSNKQSLCTRRVMFRVFKYGLSAALTVTLTINIVFVMNISKRLQDSPQLGVIQPAAAGLANSRQHGIASSNIKNVANVHHIIEAEILSSKARVSITVNGTTVFEKVSDDDTGRGIHILVLNQATGRVMAVRTFDTYQQHEDEAMLLFIDGIADGRILIFTIKDEGSFQMKPLSRKHLQQLGSEFIEQLDWRDTWVFVTIKNGSKIAEQSNKSPSLTRWGAPVLLKTSIPLKSSERYCNWPTTEENKRRKEFCDKLAGYGSVCSCKDPAPLKFESTAFEDNKMYNVPVAVMASNRPHYLYRMLQSLLTASGVNPSMITVFIDGYLDGPMMVAKLFGLRGIQHIPIGLKNARIAQHYRMSISTTFQIFPEAKYMVLVEEDLDISPDFFSYFSQTMPLLEEDPSVYCISAWNDQGYNHSSKDPALLYRIETMPGLGWMLKKQLFKDELEKRWPIAEEQSDWDMWMRASGVKNNRECIIPDISRTYHFGAKGLNMNPYFQDHYFKSHAFNTIPHVKLKQVNRLQKDNYEILIHGLVKNALVLDHSKNPCSDDFIPDTRNRSISADTQDQTYVMYIKMEAEKDYSTWLELARPNCFRMWDLDARGFHKAMWRMFMKGNHLVIVGVPASPYAIYKPDDLTPIFLEPKKEKNENKAKD